MDKIAAELLKNCWIHSNEEDTSETKVYRPKSFPLPPARGRKGLELGSDGHLIMHDFGATDMRQVSDGTWEFANGHLLLSRAGKEIESSRVILIEPDKLVLERKS